MGLLVTTIVAVFVLFLMAFFSTTTNRVVSPGY